MTENTDIATYKASKQEFMRQRKIRGRRTCKPYQIGQKGKGEKVKERKREMKMRGENGSIDCFYYCETGKRMGGFGYMTIHAMVTHMQCICAQKWGFLCYILPPN